MGTVGQVSKISALPATNSQVEPNFCMYGNTPENIALICTVINVFLIRQVHLYIYGIFHCGTVDTRSSLGTSGCGCQVISVCLSENLRSLSVIVKLETDNPNAGITTLLLLYDTTLLASRKHELSVVAKKYGEIITLTEIGRASCRERV